MHLIQNLYFLINLEISTGNHGYPSGNQRVSNYITRIFDKNVTSQGSEIYIFYIFDNRQGNLEAYKFRDIPKWGLRHG